MTIQEAIDKAFEGDWAVAKKHQTFEWPEGGAPKLKLNNEAVFLDPLFWQALGRGMGWNKTMCLSCNHFYSVPLTDLEKEEVAINRNCEHEKLKIYHQKWRDHWHRLIDHLAEGKSIEDYFQTL